MEMTLLQQKLNERRLRDIAQAGDIEALYDLIGEDSLVLKRIDETPFVDTPLHIATSWTKPEFAMEVINLMPSYAKKLNQNGASPLHLAVLHSQDPGAMIDCLLRHDKDLARVKGMHGMTPLFHAVSKGDLDLLVKFLVQCPECIKDENFRGETALHHALKNNNIEAFKLLVGWLRRSTHKDARDWEDQVLNSKDRDQNTLLHIAAYRGHAWVVRLLIKSKLVDISTRNREGFTARQIAKRFGYKEITKILWWPATVRALIPTVVSLKDYLRSNVSAWDTIKIHLKREKQSISNETRDALLVVFTLVATANYEAALSPPGGLWQGSADTNSPKPTIFDDIVAAGAQTNTTSAFGHSATPPPGPLGTMVMDFDSFRIIWWLNTLTMVITFILILFLFPRGSRRLLLLPLCLMATVYSLSMSVITPGKGWDIVNAGWFLPFLTLIYFVTWFGPVKEMIDRKIQRERGSSDIK